MRRLALALLSCLSCSLLVPEIASAAPPGRDKSNSQFQLRKDDPGGADGTVARSRARSGDCAGALPSFDAAIRMTIEPSLRRDRGLCHEKLSHPYPAIEDYRAYLTARPDANDADQIRDRLSRLEEQVGQGGPSAESTKGNNADSTPTGGSMEASFSAGGGGANATAASSSGHHSRDSAVSSKDKTYDEYLAQEKLADAADTSPLRYGEGWILGPFVHIPRYFFSKAGTSDMSYAVGGTLRYSLGSSFSMITEFGYTAIGTSGENTSSSGPLVFLGGEIRIPISRYASDHIIIGAGIGFERYVVSGTKIGGDIVPARGRLGYRHVFGPSLGLEIAFDGGAGLSFADAGGDSEVVGIAGGTIAFVVGF